PIGFFFANGTFLLLSWLLTDEQFMSWGWRVPFIFSAVLVIIGLYVRVSLHETPVFAKVAAAKKQVKIPLGTLLTKHVRVTILGTFIMLATYTLFYIMTVYSMTYSTAAAPVGLGLPRNEILWMLMMAVIGFGVMVPVAGLLADAFGRRKSMVIITTLIILFALFAFTPLLGSGNPALCAGIRIPVVRPSAGIRIPVVRPEPDGTDLRPNGSAAAGAISDGSALYRRIVFLQCVINSGRFRRAIYCRMAAKPLRAGGGRGLPGVNGGADADCTAVNP
ncbi:Major facilitator superfamily, partial [Salmonella enterica subsp. enterica serovar Minnesota str. A4-603]